MHRRYKSKRNLAHRLAHSTEQEVTSLLMCLKCHFVSAQFSSRRAEDKAWQASLASFQCPWHHWPAVTTPAICGVLESDFGDSQSTKDVGEKCTLIATWHNAQHHRG